MKSLTVEAGTSDYSSFAPATPSLTRNFLWTFIGNVTYAGCQWVILISIAKLGTANMVGQFAYGLAMTVPVVLFANLNLRAVLATDARGQFSFRTYLGLRLTTSTMAFVGIALIVSFLSRDRSTRLVILAVGFAKVVESLGDLLYGCLQQHERMDRIATSMMIKGILSATSVGLTMYFTHSILAGVIALSCIWTAVLICYDVPNCIGVLRCSRLGIIEEVRAPRPGISRQSILGLLFKAAPLGVVAMLISLSGNLPRYYIEHDLGMPALGVFAAMAYLMTAGNTVANALAESAIPKLAKLYGVLQLRAFWRLLGNLLLVAAAMGAAGIVMALAAGRVLLELIYGREYAEHSDVFVWLMVAAALGYLSTFLGTAATSTRAFSQFIIPCLVSTVVAAVASRLLIPKFGLVGAAWALSAVCVASCIAAVVIMITARRKNVRQQVTCLEANAYVR